MVLAFAVLFATLVFVSVGCASGTTPPEEEWNQTFGGAEGDRAYSVQQTADGGYILAGETWSYGAGFYDVWLVKTDADGNEQWNKTFGGTTRDSGHSVQQTTDGGYILAGSTSSAGSYDFRLVKTDLNGNTQWDKTFGGIGDDVANSVQQTTDGGYILAGSTLSYGAGKRDVWMVKTDSNGNEQWNKTFGGPDYDSTNSVQQTTDGGYILAGSKGLYGMGGSDVWLVKTDSNGNKQWDKTFGGTGHDYAHSVQQTADGGYILAGYTQSYGAGRPDVWLVKTDADGDRQWDKIFGGPDIDMANSAQQTADGGYILAGETESYGAGGSDVWLVKTDADGDKQWDRTFGSTGNDAANSIQQTADGGYILTGEMAPSIGGSADLWLIKLKGELTETLITPELTKPTPTPITTPTESTPTPSTPAFETIFAVAGLLAVAYLLKRWE